MNQTIVTEKQITNADLPHIAKWTEVIEDFFEIN